MMDDAAAKKKKKMMGCVLVACVLGFLAIPVAGILAAIAVPAFIRYTRKSKEAEAHSVLARTVSSITAHYSEHCKFPSDGPPTMSTTPSGGNKATASYTGGWKEIGMDANTGSAEYFSYSFAKEGSNMVIRAEHDFNSDGAPNHTMVRTILAGPGKSCQTTTTPIATNNVFK